MVSPSGSRNRSGLPLPTTCVEDDAIEVDSSWTPASIGASQVRSLIWGASRAGSQGARPRPGVAVSLARFGECLESAARIFGSTEMTTLQPFPSSD